MDKYEKIRVIGRGAYGTVYLSRMKSTNRDIIIKQIPVEQMTREERQAAITEVKVLSMLDHPNIIEYYENFLEDKALMIVMEYAEGGTLYDYIQQRNNQLLEEEEIMRFFVQMLLSIQHVHGKQILHRDLKTQNILLDKKRKVIKIGDFGISKVLSSKSKAYSVVGTPCYISPELCEGKPYNQKSDIWALGCILYELTTLKRAFEAQNLPALILKIMRGTIVPISEHYSDELKVLILSMLHLDPNKRPTINQIMGQPIVLNTLMYLYMDFGKVPCRRMPRPLSSLQVPGRSRSGIPSRGSSSSFVSDQSSPVIIKPVSLCSVYCWGPGFITPTRLPIPSQDTQVVQVSAGRTQKAAVTKNGGLFVWEASSLGSDNTLPGAMGYDVSTALYVSRYLEGQSGVTIKHVSCGDLFTACLTDRGILMTFGSGGNGCLGHGNYNDVQQAKIVEELLGFEVVHVSCGASHVLAVSNEFEVFAWGRGDNGRLGLGEQVSHCSPQQVPLDEDQKAISVFCGLDCSMVLLSNNRILCCGSNRCNKLGLDVDGQNLEEAHRFNTIKSPPLVDVEVKTAAMGTSHSVIVTTKGECFSLGSNQYGQLGAEQDKLVARQPQRVKNLENEIINMVACGDTFSVAISKGGEVFSWGNSTRGRLGRSDSEGFVATPVVFEEEEMFSVSSLSCNHGSTLLVTKPIRGTAGLD